MIKKLIGIIVAVAVIVIIVVAAVRRDNFRSMVLRDERLNGVDPTREEVVAEPAAVETEVDSLTVVVTDSI